MVHRTTSPTCSPPLPFSVRRKAVSTAYSSKGFTCQLAPERSSLSPANFSFCSGLGTRFIGTRIFTWLFLFQRRCSAALWGGVDGGRYLTGGYPQRLFEAEEDLL